LMHGGDHTYDNIRLTHNACNNTAQRGRKVNRKRRRDAWASRNATETRANLFGGSREEPTQWLLVKKTQFVGLAT
jgi:hypothetical protein